jgi:hypothetical protein
MVKLSPVVIFCYQRIKLLKLLIESLKKIMKVHRQFYIFLVKNIKIELIN